MYGLARCDGAHRPATSAAYRPDRCLATITVMTALAHALRHLRANCRRSRDPSPRAAAAQPDPHGCPQVARSTIGSPVPARPVKPAGSAAVVVSAATSRCRHGSTRPRTIPQPCCCSMVEARRTRRQTPVCVPAGQSRKMDQSDWPTPTGIAADNAFTARLTIDITPELRGRIRSRLSARDHVAGHAARTARARISTIAETSR